MILRNKIGEYLIVFFILSFIYCVYTYPLVLNFDQAFLGDDDAHIYIFNAFSYANSANPMFTDWILYPNGDSMWMHTHTLGMSVFASLFENDLLGINIFILLHFSLSGLGAYLISKKFLDSKAYSFICAFVFAFSSYKIARLTCHTNLVLTGFVPFYIYFFLNLSEESNRFVEIRKMQLVSIFGFVLSFLLSALCDYVVTICGLYFLFSYALYFPISSLYQKYQPKTWKLLLGGALVIVVFDQLIQFLRNEGYDHKGGMWAGADLVSIFIPFNNRFVGSQGLLDWYYSLIGESAYTVESVMYLGYSLILFGILAIFLKKTVLFSDPIKGLLFSSIFLVLICLPQFRIFGKRLFFSPTAIHHFIPGLNEMRVPLRVFSVLILVMAILIFYTLLKSKWKEILQKCWMALGIFVLLFLDYFPSSYIIQRQNEVPQVYQELANRPGKSLLVYPFGIFDGYKGIGKFDKIQLSNIRIHRKKLFGGHLSRLSEKHFDYIRNNYFLSTLCALEEGKSIEIDKQKVFESAASLPIDYVIIPSKYRNDKGAIFLQNSLKDDFKKIEEIDGDLLISLK